MKKTIDMVVVGQRLRKLRGIRTRVGASKELGIGCSTLQAYEEGKRTPRNAVREKLAAYYNTSVDDLFYCK